MIFVTVGTHEQPFNRLIECVDSLVANGTIKEEVVMQIGYGTYEPKHCKYSKIISYQEMTENVKNARIVITHGGPASFIMPLQLGKIPVVVPRQKKFNEHVNDHQAEFCKAVSERQKNIIVVEDINGLINVIESYDLLCKNMSGNTQSNNARFNEEFKKIVDKLMQ